MSKDNAKSQAGFFLTVLKSVVVGPCDIGAAGDFEWELPGDELPIAEKVELAKQWLKEVRAATGKPPVLYVPVPYLRQISDPSDFAGNPLWVAQYTSEPKLPTDRTRYDFWQFSDSHFGPTLSPRYSTQSGMGLNLFNGSKADLFALAK